MVGEDGEPAAKEQHEKEDVHEVGKPDPGGKALGIDRRIKPWGWRHLRQTDKQILRPGEDHGGECRRQTNEDIDRLDAKAAAPVSRKMDRVGSWMFHGAHDEMLFPGSRDTRTSTSRST